MKATDLMIGDWVVYNGDVEYTNPIKIEGMDIATDMLITSDREDVGFNGVEPIPLTGEFLEKNFAKRLFFDGEFEGYSYVTDGMQIDQLADSVFEWICPGTINGILNLKYVHELQHALRLCGIDKEIKL